MCCCLPDERVTICGTKCVSLISHPRVAVASSTFAALDKDFAYIHLVHRTEEGSVASWEASWVAFVKRDVADILPSYSEEAEEEALLLVEDLESCTKV